MGPDGLGLSLKNGESARSKEVLSSLVLESSEVTSCPCLPRESCPPPSPPGSSCGITARATRPRLSGATSCWPSTCRLCPRTCWCSRPASWPSAWARLPGSTCSRTRRLPRASACAPGSLGLPDSQTSPRQEPPLVHSGPGDGTVSRAAPGFLKETLLEPPPLRVTSKPPNPSFWRKKKASLLS